MLTHVVDRIAAGNLNSRKAEDAITAQELEASWPAECQKAGIKRWALGRLPRRPGE